MSRLGGRGAFPNPPYGGGMSYREWLTGQIGKGVLSNPELMVRLLDAPGEQAKKLVTQTITDIVNDLLEKLDKQ